MYPYHVFDLEPAGTFGMYPICYWRVSGGYIQPEPAMYSRCFHWFPGPLAPSVEKSVCRCRDRLLHWGQGVVSWASTLQIHHKEMDKVLSQYPPSIPQVHSEFSKPIFLQFSQHRKWSVHSQCSRSCDWDFPIRKILGMFKVFPKNVTVMFLSGSFKDFFVVSPVV